MAIHLSPGRIQSTGRCQQRLNAVAQQIRYCLRIVGLPIIGTFCGQKYAGAEGGAGIVDIRTQIPLIEHLLGSLQAWIRKRLSRNGIQIGHIER